MPQYTPTQHKILQILSDGLPHRREELHTCLSDDLSTFANLQAHISLLRKKLRPIGEDVVCEAIGYARLYRHIRLLASAIDGRK